MKRRNILASALALVMATSLVACGGNSGNEASTTAEDTSAATASTVEETADTSAEATTEAEAEPAEEEPANDTLVYGTSTFGQKFSPFFATTAYDMEVVDLTQEYLLTADRGGAVLNEGGDGVDEEYNGTSYHYEGAGNVEVVQNDDGSVDYNLTMREDIVFADGTPADIDDVIFGIYVACDPTYDGSSTYYAIPIEGMEEYRSGMESVMNLILAAGPDGYKETENYTEEQYNTFWAAFDTAGTAFAQEILDYVVANGLAAEEDGVAAQAAQWGFELEEEATVEDFWAKIVETYGYDLSDDGINYENAGSSISDLIAAELGDSIADYQRGVETGESAPNIAGIIRTGDYSLTVHTTEFDAPAIYQMSFPITPLHYYGDESAYDYENNQFGFTKGDLASIKAKNTQPLGAGRYSFVEYSNGVVTLEANEHYYKGEPKIKNLLMREGLDSDYVPGIVTGTYDLAQPSINDDVLKAIQDANGGELTGDVLSTYLIDYRGYGYLGINANLVNVGGDPASDASKALRKGFMTLFSVYRDTAINSYYGDRAAVIQYPISNTSWAAPKPADEGYRVAYSVDVEGNQIYEDSMSEEQRFEAAKEAAIGYFQAAGLEYDEAEGKFNTDETWEILVPGQGQGDHPALGVATAASEALAEIGITLQVNDVNTGTWNNALEANTCMMWTAAWQSTVDPDMTQVYHSDNANGKGTNSNHYQIQDKELDQLILDARRSADTEFRKSTYKDCMDIIMDWGVELPLYQRKDCTVASSERVVTDTLPGDMTPYYGWIAEIEKLEVQ
ncbi:MAG: ABC transporter substrate-binding protein [Lachnospiraceae bacterium]|nr:ABC transporter substrate-binding protein [Lachnospiraceae bacterium]